MNKKTPAYQYQFIVPVSHCSQFHLKKPAVVLSIFIFKMWQLFFHLKSLLRKISLLVKTKAI